MKLPRWPSLPFAMILVSCGATDIFGAPHGDGVADAGQGARAGGGASGRMNRSSGGARSSGGVAPTNSGGVVSRGGNVSTGGVVTSGTGGAQSTGGAAPTGGGGGGGGASGSRDAGRDAVASGGTASGGAPGSDSGDASSNDAAASDTGVADADGTPNDSGDGGPRYLCESDSDLDGYSDSVDPAPNDPCVPSRATVWCRGGELSLCSFGNPDTCNQPEQNSLYNPCVLQFCLQSVSYCVESGFVPDGTPCDDDWPTAPPGLKGACTSSSLAIDPNDADCTDGCPPNWDCFVDSFGVRAPSGPCICNNGTGVHCNDSCQQGVCTKDTCSGCP